MICLDLVWKEFAISKSKNLLDVLTGCDFSSLIVTYYKGLFFFPYNNDVIQKTKINRNTCNRALTTIIYIDRGNVSAKNIII